MSRKLDVRLHTSDLASALGALALTTGRHIVFAPGRFRPHTPRGLTLLGHELAHLGEPLAFRMRPGREWTPTTPEEHAATEQESLISQVIEQGWPDGPRMQVRRVPQVESSEMTTLAQPLGELQGRTVVSEAPAFVQASTSSASSVGTPVQSGELDQAQEPLARGRLTQEPETREPATPDLDRLAQQVYAIIKGWLRAERDRHGLYSR